ncbi:hypothetical protein ACFXTO_042494 [Malus domestica]
MRLLTFLPYLISSKAVKHHRLPKLVSLVGGCFHWQCFLHVCFLISCMLFIIQQHPNFSAILQSVVIATWSCHLHVISMIIILLLTMQQHISLLLTMQ